MHFFRIYQFFERWSLLVKNNDIEPRDADRYMRLYKPWYFWKFLDEWSARETDPYIKLSLDEIQTHVRPDRSEEPSIDEQIKSVKLNMISRGMEPS